MEGIGVVVERREDGTVLVEVERGTACGRCDARDACRGLLSSPTTRVIADDPVGVVAGQEVRLEMADRSFRAAITNAFLIPLLTMLAGAAAGFFLAGWIGWSEARDALAAVGSLVGGGAGLVRVRVAGRSARKAGQDGGRYRVWVSEASPRDAGCTS